MCTQYTPKIVTAIFEYFTKHDVITYNRKAKAPISFIMVCSKVQIILGIHDQNFIYLHINIIVLSMPILLCLY